MAVLQAGRPAGTGFAGFRRSGSAADLRADVPEPPADPGRGQAPGRRGAFPGAAQVGGQWAGQAQLGVAGDDDPGPPVRGGRVADLRGGPAEDLLEEAEGVFVMQISSLRAHLPVRKARPGLGQRRATPPGAGDPLDLDHHRRPHPAPPRPADRQGPPAALGASPQAGNAEPRPRPPRFWPPGCAGRDAGQPAKTLQGRPRPSQRTNQHPRDQASCHQENRMTSRNGLKRKLVQTLLARRG
jgi:hypothetical protein